MVLPPLGSPAQRNHWGKEGIVNIEQQLFVVERNEQTLILSPTSNLSELELTSLDEAIRDVMQQLDALGFRNIVLDFSGTDYYGSTALGFFIKLWKRVRSIEGNMVFCNVSAHELEVLELTRLDKLRTICSTRIEALQHLQSE